MGETDVFIEKTHTEAPIVISGMGDSIGSSVMAGCLKPTGVKGFYPLIWLSADPRNAQKAAFAKREPLLVDAPKLTFLDADSAADDPCIRESFLEELRATVTYIAHVGRSSNLPQFDPSIRGARDVTDPVVPPAHFTARCFHHHAWYLPWL